jgi:F-type H+-transporting ATPase subunit epsilon
MPLNVTIVTAERTALQQDGVTKLVVPTTEGQITILPSHAALMASLAIGELIVHTDGELRPFVVHGGFIQVAHDEVKILADAAEEPDEIDEARAEAARERAEQRISERVLPTGEVIDLLRAQLALQRALMRLNVKRRAGRGTGVPSARP